MCCDQVHAENRRQGVEVGWTAGTYMLCVVRGGAFSLIYGATIIGVVEGIGLDCIVEPLAKG